MAFDGSGNHSRTNGTNTGSTLWASDRDAGTKITAARHDIHDEDLSTSLDLCICRDGQSTISANIPFNNKSITGIDGIATASGRALALTATGSAAIEFSTNGTNSWNVTSGGDLVPQTDSTYDIGTTSLACQQIYTDGLSAITGNDLNLYAQTSQDINLYTGGSIRWIVDSNGDLVCNGSGNNIIANTADGSDNIALRLCGGGDFGSSRGAFIQLSGNEQTDTGVLQLGAGNVSGGDIELHVGGTPVWKVEEDGDLVSQGAYNLDMGEGELIQDFAGMTATGTVQGDAVILTGQVCTVDGADGTKGVSMPDAAIGAVYIIHNQSGTLKLYPHSGGNINGGSTNANVSVAARETVTLFKTSATGWRGGVSVNF